MWHKGEREESGWPSLHLCEWGGGQGRGGAGSEGTRGRVEGALRRHLSARWRRPGCVGAWGPGVDTVMAGFHLFTEDLRVVELPREGLRTWRNPEECENLRRTGSGWGLCFKWSNISQTDFVSQTMLFFRYLNRFSSELEQIELRNSFKDRQGRRHCSREAAIRQTLEREQRQYQAHGLGAFRAASYCLVSVTYPVYLVHFDFPFLSFWMFGIF